MSDPTTNSPVQSVSIAMGCILCGQCEKACPEVFALRTGTAVVRANADRYYRTLAAQILQAERECPVQVIRVRRCSDSR